LARVPGRNRPPIDETRNGGNDAADDTCRDHPVRGERHLLAVRKEIDHIEDGGGRQQSERKDDQDRMRSVSQNFELALHSILL
jgi:hypothetical protein